ncbi:outer membrane lipoprotein chaperone LolA [Thalassomonas viridans]|uniref:Outer-membrane lipoprotein carrier protein n=1 Tax=Thalassomonas viridans TaxID=137584 RepID=A0AAE9Z0C3_9GAMM|nr:outer membrane lipoprotein chaperone LolA [Thalassomonas viridans]WDE02843.1 outer membrane lipoprotein chaperone LolA [Thalassomonas viridans]
MKLNKTNLVKHLALAAGLSLPLTSALAHVDGHKDIGAKPVSKAYQTAVDTAPADKLKQEAEQAKLALLAKLDNIKHFSAQFSQQVFDADGNLLQNGAGNLVVGKPDLVYWQTTEPDESLIVSDGETLWFYDPFVEQATAYGLANAIANTPILLLTSQDKSIWQNYRISKVNDTTFAVHALDSNSQVKTLELNFDRDKLTGFVIVDASGQLSRFALTGSDFATAPKKEQFQFTLPPGAYLDDQR